MQIILSTYKAYRIDIFLFFIGLTIFVSGNQELAASEIPSAVVSLAHREENQKTYLLLNQALSIQAE